MGQYHILISGGGVGGLAAALVLGRQGHRITVFEQAAEFGDVGAGIQLSPNSFKMFEYMGLAKAITDASYFPPNLAMRDILTDEHLVCIPLGEAAISEYRFPYGVIHRTDLHNVFLNACRELTNITIRTSSKVAWFDQNADGVSVTLSENEVVTGHALIAADGIWSRIREAIVGDGKPHVSGHIAYRVLLKREAVPTHLWSDDLRIWSGEKTHLVTYPLRHGELFNLIAIFHSDYYQEGWNNNGMAGDLNTRFTTSCSPVKELLAPVKNWKMWALCDRDPVKKWSQGRVTLLGDAAHPILQYIPQGAGQAIEDCVVLGECVKKCDGDFASAFQKYQAARYLRTARVQLTARLCSDMHHATGVTRELRNHLFQSGQDPTGFAGLKWMYDGIDPTSF